MSKKSSVMWSFALPASLVFLAAAYYLRMADLRHFVDARTPVVRQLLGRFIRESDLQAEQRPAPSIASVPKAETPTSSIAPAPEAKPTPIIYNLKTITADRSIWPKKVALKRPTNFPAVQNGQVVGSILAPVGTEANLKEIRDGKVGLELNGGGAWLLADETDLVARVQAAH